MTTSAILPTDGPPPPGLTRPVVPRELQPAIAEPTEASSDRAGSRASSEDDQQTQGNERGTSGNAAPSLAPNPAVTVQVQEGQQQALDATAEDEPLPGELTEEEKAIVKELQARDREVRAHEQAHAATGAGLTGAPEYEYVRGPDGVQYAVAGKVKIDTAQIPDDPEATIEKMEAVRAAALAPSRPSGQDRAVAAAAEQAIRDAEAELREKRAEERDAQFGDDEEDATIGASNPADGAAFEDPASGGEDSDDGQASSFGLANPFANRPPVETPTPISIDLIA